jgi:hypothetical protein
MNKAQDYIRKYKETKFLPALNFEGDLMVSEKQLAEMLQEYADKELLVYKVECQTGQLFDDTVRFESSSNFFKGCDLRHPNISG